MVNKTKVCNVLFGATRICSEASQKNQGHAQRPGRRYAAKSMRAFLSSDWMSLMRTLSRCHPLPGQHRSSRGDEGDGSEATVIPRR